MRRKPLALVLVGLMVLSGFLAGCRRSAAPPVDELMPEDEATAAMQEAQENTDETQEPTAEATEEPTAEPAETEAETPEVMEEELEPTAEPTADLEPVDLPTAVPTPEPLVQETATPSPSGASTYVVQPGDNLFRIALNNGVTLQALSQANNITNPSLIYVGQELSIPSGGSTTPPSSPPSGQTCSTVHVVQPGENLFRIALRYDYSQMYLAQVNGIANPSLVYVGQQICIP